MNPAPVNSTERDLLEGKARALSAERQYLHHQIDNLYLSAPLDDANVAVLDALEEREQAISCERRELHTRIDVLRAELGLPRWRPALSIHKQSDSSDLLSERNAAEHREPLRRVL